jgi:hypothetical protein
MKRKIIFVLIFVLISVVGVVYIFVFRGSPDSIIAEIQQQTITREALKEQQKTDSCYGAYIKEEEALIKIINNLLEEEVLSSAFNICISQQEIVKKAELIDKTTRAPNILACVKKGFGKEKEHYMQLYVKPYIVNPSLHNAYAFSKTIHQSEFNSITAIKELLDRGLKKPEDFPEYKKWDIPKEWGAPEEVKKMNPDIAEYPFISKVIRKLNYGQMEKDIYDDTYAFIIARLLSQDDKKWYLDGVIITKKTFDPWFQEYVKKNIKIKIYDKELLNKIKSKYSNLWWNSQ